MRPVNASMFVPSSATMASARELMQRNGVGALAVIDERYDLIGFCGRGFNHKGHRGRQNNR